MAEQLQAIKRRIKSIESTEKIANAMQLVAAAKLKQATNRFNYSRKHLGALTAEFKREIQAAGLVEDHNAYTKPHEIAPSLTIVITGSKGMCGNYNSSILKELENVEAMTTFLPLGSKGYDHIKANDMPLLEDYIAKITLEGKIHDYEEPAAGGTDAAGAADTADGASDGGAGAAGAAGAADGGEELSRVRERLAYYYDRPTEEHSFDDILDLAQRIIIRQRKGELSEVHIVYASYVNSMVFKVVNRLILRVYNTDEKPEMIPKLAELLALEIYQAIAEATLNEYGARRLAMKNASDNAEEMLTNLETRYHRARQSEITDELIEIISGTESQRALEEESKKK